MPDEAHPLGDSELRWLEDLTSRGKGDPDACDYYPGEEEALKAFSQNADVISG